MAKGNRFAGYFHCRLESVKLNPTFRNGTVDFERRKMNIKKVLRYYA